MRGPDPHAAPLPPGKRPWRPGRGGGRSRQPGPRRPRCAARTVRGLLRRRVRARSPTVRPLRLAAITPGTGRRGTPSTGSDTHSTMLPAGQLRASTPRGPCDRKAPRIAPPDPSQHGTRRNAPSTAPRPPRPTNRVTRSRRAPVHPVRIQVHRRNLGRVDLPQVEGRHRRDRETEELHLREHVGVCRRRCSSTSPGSRP